MSADEQQQLSLLQEQLANANRNAEEIRSGLSSELGRSNNEARLYRGLFWFLLHFLALTGMLRLLQR
jgi:hypothetical protein